MRRPSAAARKPSLLPRLPGAPAPSPDPRACGGLFRGVGRSFWCPASPCRRHRELFFERFCREATYFFTPAVHFPPSPSSLPALSLPRPARPRSFLVRYFLPASLSSKPGFICWRVPRSATTRQRFDDWTLQKSPGGGSAGAARRRVVVLRWCRAATTVAAERPTTRSCYYSYKPAPPRRRTGRRRRRTARPNSSINDLIFFV